MLELKAILLTQGMHGKVSQSDEAFLRKKAANSKFSYSTLKKVLNRGRGAYLSSGSKNVSMTAWSRGRVNSFIRGGGARKADADLLKKKT